MESVRAQVKTDHASGLLRGVSGLRKDAFIPPDFDIKVGEKSIPVHRAILASTSGYFHAMFSHPVQEVSEGYIDMKGVTYEAIEQSMEFTYTGEADINMGNVKDVAYAAELLQLTGLSRLCSNYLKLDLNTENCVSTRDIAELYSWDELRVLAENFVIQNFEAIISTSSFLSLDVADLGLYLKASEVGYEVSWRAVTHWIKAEEDREAELFHLMETINVEQFPFSYIVETILEDPLVTKSTLAKDFAASIVLSDLQRLESYITIDNCFTLNTLINWASTPDTKEASETVHRFLMTNFDRIMENDEYKCLSIDEVKLLCGSSKTECTSEMTRWNFILGWLKHEHERTSHFPELFEMVDLGQMTLDFLETQVAFESLMKEFPQCEASLQSVFNRSASEESKQIPESETQIALLDNGSHALMLLQVGDAGVKTKKLAKTPKENEQRIVSVRDELYLISDDKVYFLDVDDGRRWKRKGFLQKAIEYNTQVECIDGTIFLIHELRMWMYEVTTAEQSSVPGCFLGHGFCAAAAQGIIYAMGGLRTSKQAKIYPCSHAAEGILSPSKWEDIPLMNHERVDASAIGTGKQVYVIGGIYAGQVHASVEVYESSSKSWTIVPGMLTCRRHLATYSSGKKIFAIGGDHSTYSVPRSTVTVGIYDADRWQEIAVNLHFKGTLFACEVPLRLQGTGIASSNITGMSNASITARIIRVIPDGGIALLPGCKIIFPKHLTLKGIIHVKISVNSHPDDLPLVWEPVTSAFRCQTRAVLLKPAELSLISSYSTASDSGVAVLQKLGGDWEYAGVTNIVDGRVMLNITGSCELIAAIPKSKSSTMDIADGECVNFSIKFKRPPVQEVTGQASEPEIKKVADCTKSIEAGSSHVLEAKDLNQLAAKSPNKVNEEESEAIRAEFVASLATIAHVTTTIGPKGGDIELYGCSLNFPPDALKEEKEITLSVDNNPENYPPNLVAIAPILGFKPSMNFDKPVTVGTRTWYSALDGETIPAILSSRKSGSEWKKVGEITIDSTNEVRFTVTHFCKINLGLAPENNEKGQYTSLCDIYIQRNTARVLSSVYLDPKSERDIWEIMQRRNCAVFSTKTLRICEKPSQKVSLKLDILDPARKSMEDEFQICDVLKYGSHHMQFNPKLKLKDYDGYIEGEMTAIVDSQEKDKAELCREWPATPDPPGPPIVHTVATGLLAEGNAQITVTTKDVNVTASTN